MIGLSAKANDFVPLTIMGEIVDLGTDLPLKKATVYLSRNSTKNFEVPNPDFTHNTQTDKSGKFRITIYLDRDEPEFWLSVLGSAQLHFKNVPSNINRIDLGTLYAVFYENELEEERINFTKIKYEKQKRVKHSIFTINEVIELFSEENTHYNMSLNPIDTIDFAITSLNFGPDKPRGRLIQKYKQISFLHDFSKVRNEGLTEIPTYHQRLLYQKHHLDSIIITQYELEDEDTVYLGQIKKFLNDSGYVIRTVQYCTNGAIMMLSEHDSIGRKVMSTGAMFNCDGKPNGYIKTTYGPYGPTKKQSYFFDDVLGSTWSWEYDNLGREIQQDWTGYLTFGWTESTTYYDQHNTSVMLKIMENGDTLSKQIVNYHNGREFMRKIYMGDSLTSKISTSYDKFYNLYHVKVEQPQMDAPIQNDYYYYKTPFKKISQKKLVNWEEKTYQFTRFHYNQAGLLILESQEQGYRTPGCFSIYTYY